MTDFKLPVIRHLTADEVEPGMTIAGESGDIHLIGVASHRIAKAGSWLTDRGRFLGDPEHGYDLLAEAPKPKVGLPQEADSVIRYRNLDGDLEIAQKISVNNHSWLVDGIVSHVRGEEVLARGARDGYEVAHWHKPGEGPGIPKKLHEKLRGMDPGKLDLVVEVLRLEELLKLPHAHAGYVLDLLRWAVTQPVQDGEA
ncbi:hypothetical protein ODZ83_05520 [Acaricomes phytoseiuli]|uniref:hypothetical protein n=1 Tax=Acaricomes phytoseiuli TaxID=291968 RepID=UPI002223020A|nr:hypothetical protein [Acaricomes phytoseiuli]MCW1249650.1 hypothetical protein [Acaricomes phytoseiuli]